MDKNDRGPSVNQAPSDAQRSRSKPNALALFRFASAAVVVAGSVGAYMFAVARSDPQDRDEESSGVRAPTATAEIHELEQAPIHLLVVGPDEALATSVAEGIIGGLQPHETVSVVVTTPETHLTVIQSLYDHSVASQHRGGVVAVVDVAAGN